ALTSGSISLSDFQQLDFKAQGAARGNHALALLAIGEPPRNEQRALLAFLHGEKSFIPTLDDGVGADAKNKGAAAVVRTVEFATVEQEAVVMGDDLCPERRRRSFARCAHNIPQARGVGVGGAVLFTQHAGVGLA